MRGELFVVTGALLWSTGGVGIKLLDGFSPLAVSSGRSLLCGLLFLALARGRVHFPRQHRAWVFAGIFCYAGVVTAFVLGNRLTTAANTILLQHTAPLWIAVLGWALLRERPHVRELLALPLGAGGVLLCVGASGSEGEHAFTGDLIALLSGVFFAMLTLVLRRLGQHQAAAGAKETSPAFLCLIFGNLLGALIGLPALISSIGEAGVPGQPVAMGWLLMLWLGLGQLGAGYWFFQRGLRTTRALTAGLLNLIEPILNPVWVALVAGEFPTSRTLVGGAILMVALTITVSRPRAVKISPHVAIGSDGASRANAEKR